MGYGFVPDLTDDNIVCQSDCSHGDCKMTRDQWENAKCCLCGEPFKPNAPFYYESGKPAHARCVWDKYES